MYIKTILVPFDFGEPSQHALAYARGFAELLDASLHLLSVVPNPYLPNPVMPLPPELPSAYTVPAELVEQLMTDAESRLDGLVSEAEKQAARVRTFVLAGDARKEILEHAAREHVDMIVMGTHGRTGAAHLFLGSVAERVVRAARCPVLTVR